MSVLRVNNLSTGYGKKQVLFDVSLDIKEGETILLVGSNGSGKSTLLKTIYGLIDVWSGTIEYDNELLQSNEQKTLTHKLIQKGIMYIPQKDALFEDMTVEENLRASLLHIGNKKSIEQTVYQVMGQMPILQERRKQLVNRLSGGERKQLSLAMVAANTPKLLLLDEPLAGVSNENVPTVLQWLNKIRQNDVTILVVEHRIQEFFKFADNVVGLKLGQLHTDKLDTINNIKSFMI
ncbi:MAG: ATP-binding cassette domain-containing protein [Prevotella sp.]|nr:ATP-binding cassette domain-containing protein [Prevotella sp.]